MGKILLKIEQVKDGDQLKWAVVSVVETKEIADSLKEMYSKMLREVFQQQ